MAGEERSSGGCRGSGQEPQTREWRLWRPCQSTEEGGVLCTFSVRPSCLEIGYRELTRDM